MRTLPAPIITCLGLVLAGPVLANPNLVRNEHGGALQGKTVVLSPSHGRMLQNGSWIWQRPLLNDIREDIHNAESMIVYLQRYLLNAGARVEFCRERSFQTHEVIVDDASPGYTSTGTWTSSSNVARHYRAGYRWAAVDPSGVSATATWTPDLPAAGRYPVYVWWPAASDRTRDARYVIHHTGGQTRVTIAQHVMGGHWVFLGEFQFAKGTAGKVVLQNQGSDATKVVIADAVRFGGGVGPSGLPRWKEGAKSYLTYKGYSSGFGEVTIRPAYATWLAGGGTTLKRSFAYLSLHTNAGGGTGTTAYSYGNGRNGIGSASHSTAHMNASDRLRDLCTNLVSRDVQALFDPAWRNRGGGIANFGECREARNMAATLVELAFHDDPGDSARLRSPAFRRATARALYKALLRYFDPNATVLPLAPTDLVLENQGEGKLRVSWSAPLDPLEPSAAPGNTATIYVSKDGFGFDDGRRVTGTSAVLDGFAPGERVFVQVTLHNAGGESLPTRTGGVRVGDPQRAALIVDGFNREYRHTHDNIAGRYTYDYAIEHVQALDAALPAGAAVDYAQASAVAPGQLDRYALLDWLLGRESSADRTFDPAEQTQVEQYLTGGGRLLVSGTEVGWDLEARGGGTPFLHDVLKAGYVADDAGIMLARPAAGGPAAFAGLGPLPFDTGRYAARSPDVLAPQAGGEALLAYETAGAPVAAVGTPRRSVLLAFPLEAVGDAGLRADLATAVVTYLDPDLSAAPPPQPPANPGATAPVGSTTAPGATAPPAGGGSSGGGGCALQPAGDAGAGGLAFLLLGLGLLAVRRRR